MKHVQQVFGVSERRACQLVGQHRSTQRRRAQLPEKEIRFVREMRAFARAFPRFGYRRIGMLLRRVGWQVNNKRVHRLWRREGLQIRQKARKRRSVGSAAQGAQRFKAKFKDHVWSYDFVFDRTEDGRPLKILALVDEYTRECLLLHVARRIKGRDVIDLLMSVMAERGVPRFLRSDNGPEFLARKVKQWLRGIGALHPLHRAREPMAERLRRIIQRQAQR